MRNLVTDHDEWVDAKHFIRSKIMDIPLQSLFYALINYRVTMERYFYLPSSKEQVEQKERFATATLQNFEFVHLDTIKGGKSEGQSHFCKKLLKGKSGSATEYYQELREAKIKAL